MNQPRIGDAQHSLWRTNVLESLKGNYVEAGLDWSPGSSGSAIQSELDGGTVRFVSEGSVGVAPDTLTHDPVPTQGDYRMDVVYATRQGGLEIAPGQPGQPKPTVGETPYPEGGALRRPRSLYWPAPPDGSQINGLPLHVIVIGDTMANSTDLALEDRIDYRIPAVEPGEHQHPDLALNRRTYDLESSTGEIVKLATVNDGTSGVGACRVQLWSSNATPNVTPRVLDVGVVTRDSQVAMRPVEYGPSVDGVDLFITEQSSDSTGTTQSRYHLYARLPSDAGTYAIVEHRGDSWGEDQLVTGLGANDVLGTVERDTADPAKGGVRRVLAAESSGASAGNVPIRQADGSTEWATATEQSGEWVPLSTQRFPTDSVLSTTSEDWVVASPSSASGVLFDLTLFDSDRYSTFGVSFSARVYAGNAGAPARASLSSGYANYNQVVGSILDTTNASPTRLSGGPNEIDNTGGASYYLALDSNGSAAANVDSASVTIWGQQR